MINCKTNHYKLFIKRIIDIVFCIDCTNGGALARCIAPSIIRYLESLNSNEKHASVDWRARVLGFGDLDLGEEMQNSNVFVADVDSFRKQISKLESYCGGDELESTLDAICYAAIQSDWRDRCHKIVCVLTDAFTKEIHPSTAEALGIFSVEELKLALVNNRVLLYLFGPQDPVYKLFEIIPKSQLFLMENAYENLYCGRIDLTNYLNIADYYYGNM